MHWIDDIQQAINYIEKNLLEDITARDVAKHIHSSKDHFQMIFGVVTGFSVGEYIRNRRLSLAGRELAECGPKVIDTALKYGYETPESFTKAFARFHGATPSAVRARKAQPRSFRRLTIQITMQGGFNMSVILDVRAVGYLNNLPGDPRSPESFALPACMASLMEHLGEDTRWETIQAHGRDWQKRKLYDAILAATGMGFGLLWWHGETPGETCPSSFDLTQVNAEHDETIKRAFAYMGYTCEIIERTDDNFESMKRLITESVGAGKPVLAFGPLEPREECSIVCGYDDEGATLFGWSHWQSRNPADTESNGMFRASDWHQNMWKIVLCGEKTQPKTDLREMIQHGLAIATADGINGLYAGHAAYGAWANYIDNPAWRRCKKKDLKQKYWFHSVLVGNHAEARAYLGGFLRDAADGDARLIQAANMYNEIHDTCWKVWGAAGGMDKKSAWKVLRKAKKRGEIIALIRRMEALDFAAAQELQAFLGE
ncbi:MAG: AraC family transcriptional regulator [Firmicutes bacterium]|nr:AraC family transcriptional regulator [Bacillota bacterium]